LAVPSLSVSLGGESFSDSATVFDRFPQNVEDNDASESKYADDMEDEAASEFYPIDPRGVPGAPPSIQTTFHTLFNQRNEFLFTPNSSGGSDNTAYSTPGSATFPNGRWSMVQPRGRQMTQVLNEVGMRSHSVAFTGRSMGATVAGHLAPPAGGPSPGLTRRASDSGLVMQAERRFGGLFGDAVDRFGAYEYVDPALISGQPHIKPDEGGYSAWMGGAPDPPAVDRV